MKIRLVLTFVALVFCYATADDGPLRFDNFQVYLVTPRSLKQLEILRNLEENPQGYVFWSEVTFLEHPVHIMVPPHLEYNFQDFLKMQRLDGQVWIENVQTLIDNEKPTSPKTGNGVFNWKEYQTLDDIYAWLDSLVDEYPGLVTPLVGGESHEGREIRGVKVSFGPGRKGAFIEAGIHAREWIAPATATYILNEILTSDNATVREAVESRDWYIFPSFNPDGYVYTHTRDRMWRKTRKPYGTCVGADPNRNWDYHWMHGGASSAPCSETHAGDAPFSEIETKSLSEYISTIADTLDIYLDFHSFSQLVLIPFGHAGLEVPENNDELHRIGKAAADSLKVRYGTHYTVGNIPQAIYVASGGSIDWVKGVHRNIRIVYCYELRDTGRHGFILPPDQIIPSGEETLDSVIRIIHEVNAS